ncbi:hypothetical protein [Vibrio owensii]|uniref:hypothetical protein n=1 Tax=Vibrio owensii TaxID=696485 RepID=UPI0018F27809|nr:hypothetical protein [Vibrio owensii]
MINRHFTLQGSGSVDLPLEAQFVGVEAGVDCVKFHFTCERGSVIKRVPSERRAFEIVHSFEDFPERFKLLGEFIAEYDGKDKPVWVLEVPLIDWVNKERVQAQSRMINASASQF